MPFLEIATTLIERGFSVIPLEKQGKRPMPGWGATNRTKDPSVVAGWAAQYPDANVAICADENIVILETDDYEAFETALKNGTGTTPVFDTARAFGSSPNRPHFFFKRTARADNVGNLAVPGLFEARFSNQYVVGPGSVHPSGATYSWVEPTLPVREIPDWLISELARLALKQKDRTAREINRVGGKIAEGSRHYFLMSEGGRLWNGKITEEQLTDELRRLNETFCEPPKSDGHVLECVRDLMRRDPYDPGPTVVIGGAEVAKPGPRNPRPPDRDEYIVPGTGKLEGWFVKGELNLVVGASGAGKTTVMLQVLESIRQNLPVFGHPPRQCEYRVVMHDRSEKGFARTVRRMRLGQDSRQRIHRLSRAEQKASAVDTLDKYLKRLEEKNQVPDVVFIEGLDFWAHDDINKASVVEDFCSDLIEMATSWDVALVGSVGCPKQKAKDKYQQSRDNVNGSAAWGRKVETIMFLMLSNPENPNSARKMEVLARNGPAEIFQLGFQDGLLVPLDPDKDPPEGVAETKALLSKPDRHSRLIEDLRKFAPGTRLESDVFSYVPQATLYKDFRALAGLGFDGWTALKDGKWVRGNKQ